MGDEVFANLADVARRISRAIEDAEGRGVVDVPIQIDLAINCNNSSHEQLKISRAYDVAADVLDLLAVLS